MSEAITNLNRELRVLRRKNTKLKVEISALKEELQNTGRYTFKEVASIIIGFEVIIAVLAMVYNQVF